MAPPRFIARQLSLPVGFWGRLVMRLMNRTNAGMNAFAMRQLRPSPADRILEIGFGGGVNLPVLVGQAAFVGGIDRSREAVERAKAEFAGAVQAGRAEFRQGSIESLPFEAESFGKICTVNTIYFWTSLAAGCAEIHRVLSPGGRLVLGFLPKDRMDRRNMPADIFTVRALDDVVDALGTAGFSEIRVERPEPETPWVVVVAWR